ncbi:AI-2E family transporter [Arthrobacter sp. KK5.5]|uniref:AI-2E family transporter n=1 Tax=Arthrobacter sp. KK5.5 TaxID=3373084 RepID=UPI003EE764C0
MAQIKQDPGEGMRWPDSLSRAGERSRQLLWVLALVAVAIFVLLQVRLVVIPFLLALILAAAIVPLVNWLRRRGWPDALATGTAFIALLTVFGAVVAGIVVTVRSQWDSLVAKAGEGFDQLYALLRQGPLPVDDVMVQDARESAMDFATSAGAGNPAVDGIFAATEFAAGFVLMAVILFFFLKDGRRMWVFCLQPFTGRQRAKTRLAGIRSIEVLGGYVRGTAIVALVDSVLIGIALWILQVPLALPLAAVVFVGAFIPLIGATFAGVLAAVVALVANGPLAALIVVGVIVAVNQLEGNLLQPVVMGKTLNIHPLVILVSLTAGTVLAGITGAILAVPVAAVGWSIAKIWIGNRFGADPFPGRHQPRHG